MHEFNIFDPNWRKTAGNDSVILSNGTIVLEREVYLAVEKLTKYLQETEDRYPNEEDIIAFICALRGP